MHQRIKPFDFRVDTDPEKKWVYLTCLFCALYKKPLINKMKPLSQKPVSCAWVNTQRINSEEERGLRKKIYIWPAVVMPMLLKSVDMINCEVLQDTRCVLRWLVHTRNSGGGGKRACLGCEMVLRGQLALGVVW